MTDVRACPTRGIRSVCGLVEVITGNQMVLARTNIMSGRTTWNTIINLHH